MSERTRKVESLIQQVVAAELTQVPEAARFTVTKVQVSPDLRAATIWVGMLADDETHAERLFAEVLGQRPAMQEAVAHKLTTKFVPRLTLERDSSGEYAQQITNLIRGL